MQYVSINFKALSFAKFVQAPPDSASKNTPSRRDGTDGSRFVCLRLAIPRIYESTTDFQITASFPIEPICSPSLSKRAMGVRRLFFDRYRLKRSRN